LRTSAFRLNAIRTVCRLGDQAPTHMKYIALQSFQSTKSTTIGGGCEKFAELSGSPSICYCCPSNPIHFGVESTRIGCLEPHNIHLFYEGRAFSRIFREVFDVIIYAK